jgi:hypothetical protein
MYQLFTKTAESADSCSAMETRDYSKNGASPKSRMSRGNIVQRTFLICVVFCVCVANAFAQPGNIVRCPSKESIVTINFKDKGRSYEIYLKDQRLERDQLSIDASKGNYEFTIKNGICNLKIKYPGREWVQEIEFDARDEHFTFESSGIVVSRGTSSYFKQKNRTKMNATYFKKGAKELNKSMITIDMKSKGTMYIDDEKICELNNGKNHFWIDNGRYDLRIDKSEVYKLEINNKYFELKYPFTFTIVKLINESGLY